LDKDAIDVMIETKTLFEISGSIARCAIRDLHVRSADELAVGYTDKVALAQVFDIRDFTLKGGNLVFHFVNDLFDGVFLAAIINNEGSA
jgi:hypothetical protein